MSIAQKKYQIFVSSTYEDLRSERQEIMHALLELDCIPSGMELFPAASEDQWTLIRGVINDCDYYIVVIGGRYGSVAPDGVSYTEMEYRYALSKEKPVIAFLHKDPSQLPAKHCEQTEDGRKKLESFRQLAQKKMCKFWTTAHELGSVVSRSLIMLQKKHPGVGWVRADQMPSADATTEILRLREEIDQLKGQLTTSETEAPKGIEHLAQSDDEVELACEFESRGPGEDGERIGFKWTWNAKTSWNDLFFELSPLMLDEASTSQLKARVTTFAEELLEDQMPKEKDFEGHSAIDDVDVKESDFETVLIQLNALGLIAQSKKNRSLKDRGTYWSLTPFGRTTMNRLRAITREGGKQISRQE
jgi:hypothetical protein